MVEVLTGLLVGATIFKLVSSGDQRRATRPRSCRVAGECSEACPSDGAALPALLEAEAA